MALEVCIEKQSTILVLARLVLVWLYNHKHKESNNLTLPYPWTDGIYKLGFNIYKNGPATVSKPNKLVCQQTIDMKNKELLEVY